MMLGRISSRQNLQVTNAVGSKAKGKRSPASPARKVPVAPGSNKKGRARGDGDTLWLPNTERPEWLDGSLPGDRGFDPLGLAKPGEFLQVDLDELDQNKAVNKAGQLVGKVAPKKARLSSGNSLAPYDEVFGLQRFRECELIHGRWAMLATLGAIIDGTQYLGFSLPFSITQLVWIEAILVGGAEIYRNGELDDEKRIYPGGLFDPFALASDDSDRTSKLREAEIKHGRLAMIAFLGFSVQAAAQGTGALGSLAKFSESFAPELAEKLEEIAPIG